MKNTEQIPVSLGQKVRFDPFANFEFCGQTDCRGQTTTGTVAFINPRGRWFSVAYMGGLRTSFGFEKIGAEVWI